MSEFSTPDYVTRAWEDIHRNNSAAMFSERIHDWEVACAKARDAKAKWLLDHPGQTPPEDWWKT